MATHPLSFPEAFENRMQNYLGKDYLSFANTVLQGAPPISIRFNPQKEHSFPDNLSAVPWCSDAYYLPSRPIFTLDPSFHVGVYYVQEASSMFLHHVVKQLISSNSPIIALDLCAAPGGKSTLLLDALPQNSLLLANEVIKSRYQILRENLIKWGRVNVITTNTDSKGFLGLEGFFDLVVVDAPCSGEGLFRKDPKAMKEWSLENVNLCSARQKRILNNAVKLVKPGGYLIYCTCTYNQEENDHNAKWLNEEYGLENIQLNPPKAWQITSTKYGYQFYPHLTKGEGFYLTVLQKANGSLSKMKVNPAKSLQRLSKKEMQQLDNWVIPNSGLVYFKDKNDQIRAIPEQHLEKISVIHNQLRFMHAGINIGTIKQKGLVPAHDLAMSKLINDGLPNVELNASYALKYLAKEELNKIKYPNGWASVSYLGNRLGWIKGLNNRVNNYYPKAWRIRMSLNNASTNPS